MTQHLILPISLPASPYQLVHFCTLRHRRRHYHHHYYFQLCLFRHRDLDNNTWLFSFLLRQIFLFFSITHQSVSLFPSMFTNNLGVFVFSPITITPIQHNPSSTVFSSSAHLNCHSPDHTLCRLHSLFFGFLSSLRKIIARVQCSTFCHFLSR